MDMTCRDGLTQKHSIAKSAWHGTSIGIEDDGHSTAYFERDGFEVIPEPYISKDVRSWYYKDSLHGSVYRDRNHTFTSCGICRCLTDCQNSTSGR